MILTLYISKRGQKLTNRDVIKAIFPKIEALPNPETTSWLDRPFDLDQVKGAYSIPIDPPKYEVNADINYLSEMEKNYEGYQKSVKEIFAASKNGLLPAVTLHGTLADIIRADKKTALAFDAVLGNSLQKV